MSRLRGVFELLGAVLLTGLLSAIGVGLQHFAEFSRVPGTGTLGLLFPLAGGVLLGMLVPKLGRALGALLGMLLVGAAAGMGLLAYPEYTAGQLGPDLALGAAFDPALQGIIFAAPLGIAGLLLGHFLGARWGEPSG